MKIGLMIGASLLATSVFSQTEKDIYCPSSGSLKIELTNSWRYNLSGYNTENQFFISGEYLYDEGNGPAPALFLMKNKTNYNAREKKLSCFYYTYHKYAMFYELINTGGY